MQNPAIAVAGQAFQRGDLITAEQTCRRILSTEPRNADAQQLLGIVCRRQGKLDEAEQLLASSIELDPQRVEWRVNYSNLLRSLGRLRDAEVQLRMALKIEPSSRTARLALARLLHAAGIPDHAELEVKPLLDRNPLDAEALVTMASAQRASGKFGEAEANYRKALSIRSDYAVARHDLGALLCELGRAEEALRQFDHATRLGLVSPELHYNRGSAFFTLGRLDEADAELVSAIRLRPDYFDAQEFLAKLRYMRGEEDYTREIASAASEIPDPRLAMMWGDLLRRGGHLEDASRILRDILANHLAAPEVASSLAVVLQEQGRLREALKYAHRANEALPENPDIAENLVAILLQLGDTRTCAPLIQLWRKRDSLDQRWLAYEATAARLSGDVRYEELYDYERFTMPFDLQPPRGFSSIDDFHAELIPYLRQLHQLATHPLDQSLRHGTQTSADLLVDSSSVLQGFLEALQEPIREYRSRLGYDPQHPFLKRNRGDSEFAGCWSVRLAKQGYHVNHIHPKGWISSAYYVEVPSEVEDEEAKCGWLKFGEPRMPTPGADAAHWAKPKAGRLVLFPSYMWHGTVPIESDQPRMTIAFDVVTKQAPVT